MKRLLFALFLLCISICSSNAQSHEINFNKSIGISVGYSVLHNSEFGTQVKEGVTDMFTADLTIYCVYVGLGVGTNDISRNYSYYEEFTRKYKTYVFRIGPAFMFGSETYGITITPYVGFMKDTYAEDVSYYNPYYYNEYYSTTIYEKTLSNSFLYGGKATIYYGIIEAGAHISNKEFGLTIGLRF